MRRANHNHHSNSSRRIIRIRTTRRRLRRLTTPYNSHHNRTFLPTSIIRGHRHNTNDHNPNRSHTNQMIPDINRRRIRLTIRRHNQRTELNPRQRPRRYNSPINIRRKDKRLSRLNTGTTPNPNNSRSLNRTSLNLRLVSTRHLNSPTRNNLSPVQTNTNIRRRQARTTSNLKHLNRILITYHAIQQARPRTLSKM